MNVVKYTFYKSTIFIFLCTYTTGAADRVIKIWDLASGKLKVSLTGHVSTVRGECFLF